MVKRKKNIQSILLKWKNRENSAGFTLLELLISIVIISIILSIMSGALRLGLRAWEMGEKDSDLGYRVRIVKSLIKRQISSICTEKIFDSELNTGQVAFIVKGTDDSIEFISNYSISPFTDLIPVYAKYYVKNDDTNDLVMFEKEVSTLKHKELEDIQELIQEEDLHVMLKNINSPKFEYLKRNIDGTSEWQDFWNIGLNTATDFPAAVKINFVIEEKPVSLMVKIMSEYDV